MACTEHGHGCVLLGLVLLSLAASQSCCYGLSTFGFDIHHRFSDQIKGMLGIDDVPQKGTPQYYAVMAHRDRIFRGRKLAGADHHAPLTFTAGNVTYRIASSGLYENSPPPTCQFFNFYLFSLVGNFFLEEKFSGSVFSLSEFCVEFEHGRICVLGKGRCDILWRKKN